MPTSTPRALSMTGHGVAHAPFGAGRIEVEVRAVNHRAFEARSRLPVEIAEHAGFVEETARRLLVRGRVEILCRIDGADASVLALDVARARAAFEELTSLRDALAPREPIPLALLGSVPGLFSTRSLDVRAARASLTLATERACEAVSDMRAREGASLAADLAARLELVLGLRAKLEARSPEVVDRTRRRLAERVEKLLGAQAAFDAARLEQEVVVFADRCDVSEECTRLSSHGEQMRELLLRTREPTSGRRLDFLLQEMQREVNTIGQKCCDVEISRAVIEMKLEVERMREQVQNLL